MFLIFIGLILVLRTLSNSKFLNGNYATVTNVVILLTKGLYLMYEGRTDSHEQLCFACELRTADEEECGGRWNQLLFYP